MEKIDLAAKCCINGPEQGPAEGISLAERAKIQSLNKKKKNIIEPSLAGVYITSIKHLQVKEKNINLKLSFIDKTQGNETKKIGQDIIKNKDNMPKDVKLFDYQRKHYDIKAFREIMGGKKLTDNKVVNNNVSNNKSTDSKALMINNKVIINKKITNDDKLSKELLQGTTSELPLQSVVNVIGDLENIKPGLSYDSNGHVFLDEENIGPEKYLNNLNLYEQKFLNNSLSSSLTNSFSSLLNKSLNSSLSSNNAKHVSLKNTESVKVNKTSSVKSEPIIYKFQNTPGDNSVKIANSNSGILSLTTSSDFVHHLLQNEKLGKVVANDFELLSDSWKDEDETGESDK